MSASLGRGSGCVLYEWIRRADCLRSVNEKGKKEHILVVSQYFYPEEFRINDICREWIKRGYEVTVVTGIPNYPQGKFYQGYGLGKKRKEEYEGIHIIRLPLIPRGNNSLMLGLNYISFVISGFVWKIFTKVKADKVFIFEVSPMTQALVGVWYAKKRKLPCSIYVQDLWPENLEAVAGIHNRVILNAIDRMVDYIYRNCSRILATSPKFVERLEERVSVHTRNGHSKARYLPQYVEEFYRPVSPMPLPDVQEDKSFKIVFTGNVGFAQGLDILPRTAKYLKQSGADCRFYIIGDGRYREKLEKEIEGLHVQDRFCFTGRKAPEEIPAYLAHFDVAVLSFSDNELFQMTIPAKLQSYMACAMPILAIADGESKRIVEEADCGVCITDRDPKKAAEAIRSMMTSKEQLLRWGENAQKYCIAHFDKSRIFGCLEEFTKTGKSR